MERTRLPGLALGVLFDGEVMAAEGFGVRSLGKDAAVDAHTVFQLASISKSLAGSLMAALVRTKAFGWSDPVRTGDPDFALSGAERGPDERYVGTYGNELYGPVEVSASPEAGLQLTIRPDRQAYPLQPYDGNEMWWQFAGENAGPPAAATFRRRRWRPRRAAHT